MTADRSAFTTVRRRSPRPAEIGQPVCMARRWSLRIAVALVVSCVLVACTADGDDATVASEVNDRERVVIAQGLCPELDTLDRLLTPNADSDPDADGALSYVEAQAQDL